HAAMAGMVWGVVFGINPTIAAISAAILTGILLAPLRPDKTHIDINVALAALFSTFMGLTFLGVGLVEGSRNELYGWMWGSVLFVRTRDIIAMAVMGILVAAFASLFRREMKAILLSRIAAASTGIPDTLILAGFLALCGGVIAINLEIVGGLLIFSLITNPAAVAYQIGRRFRSILVLSITSGIFSTLGGIMVSYLLNLPTGACIVLMSALLFILPPLYRRFCGVRD
ncbi:MAG: metal ABC transporter permease, partial [Sedimentisphaerales bacterium]|nr:metal ABC transporter permease [Sedimentisphaerales bacterium]